jgi:hypothetical protein
MAMDKAESITEIMVVTAPEMAAKITLMMAMQVLVLTVVHPVALAMLVITGVMATQAAILAIRMGMVTHPIPAIVNQHPTAILVTMAMTLVTAALRMT